MSSTNDAKVLHGIRVGAFGKMLRSVLVEDPSKFIGWAEQFVRKAWDPNMPSWQRLGLWTDVIEASDAEVQAMWRAHRETIPGIRAWVEWEAEFGWVPADHWVHKNAADFILKYGQSYRPIAASPDAELKSPNNCYRNAFEIVCESKEPLTYVEGYACSWLGVSGPVLHAWCVNQKGEVIDATWRVRGDDKFEGYFGVPFDLTRVRQRIGQNVQGTALINDWNNNRPLLRLNQYFDGTPFERAAAPREEATRGVTNPDLERVAPL